MEQLSVKLDVFEGPLDLLLHLIKTLEVDIYDIPIADITTQYMNYIKSMELLKLEVAGDYIVMAATLMSIKSKMLLPTQELVMDEDGEFMEEGEDPRAALVAQLLEYRKFKYAATVLKEKQESRGQYYTKEPADLSEYKDDIQPLEPDQVSTIDLFMAFHDILERRRQLTPRETTITNDQESVDDKMAWISQLMRGLSLTTGVTFDSLFTTYTKGEIVTTFMAVLELIKSKTIIVKQEGNYEPIMIYPLAIIEVSDQIETELVGGQDENNRTN